MKNKEYNLKVIQHIVSVKKGISVSGHDISTENDEIKARKLRHIHFYVNVYFKNNVVNSVRIQLPYGWLTDPNDPIQSELLDFIRPLNPLYKDLTIKDVLPEWA